MRFAADTSSLSAYFAGEKSPDTELIIAAANDRRLFLPPVTVAEIMSAPERAQAWSYMEKLPLLPIADDYWRKAGEIRCLLLQKKLKARLADALICQSCLDADVALITRDADFRHYATWAGLKLAVK